MISTYLPEPVHPQYTVPTAHAAQEDVDVTWRLGPLRSLMVHFRKGMHSGTIGNGQTSVLEARDGGRWLDTTIADAGITLAPGALSDLLNNYALAVSGMPHPDGSLKVTASSGLSPRP